MKLTRMVPLLFGVVLLCGVAGTRSLGQNATAARGAGSAAQGRVLVPHPSWNCGMPEGIPNPESGPLVFEAEIKLDRVANVGKTPFGNRQVAVGKDGVVSGARLSGSVAPGALDYELRLGNGVLEIEQILVLKTTDGKYIYVRNAGTGMDANDVRVVLDFEAPNASEFAWLNTGKFVGRRVLNATAGTLTLRVYDVAGVPVAANAANTIRITKPAGVPEQPWDARKMATGEKQGNTLITETVTLSPSQMVGASKRGNRNIIPITGGELAGRLTGKVLMGGADYQNLNPPATIDARYLWQTNDGEVILVRNAGPFGALVPTFEARTDGPYSWLNTGSFLSSNPGGKPGGVGITMYDSVR